MNVAGMDIVDESDGGMRGGKQARLFSEGNSYLDKDFPLLDKLLKATIIQRP